MSTRSKIIFTIMAVGLYFIAVRVFQWSWPAMTRPYAATAAPKLATFSHLPQDSLVVKVWTESSRISSDCDVANDGAPGNRCPRIDLLFENKSNNNITGLHLLDFKLPGFVPADNCWHPSDAPRSGYPSCRGESGSASTLPPIIHPGESWHVWGRVTPSVRAGRFGLLALFSWNQQPARPAPNGARGARRKWRSDQAPVDVTLHSGAVSLQPIEITSPIHESVGTAERLLQNLALPLVVAAFAWYFQLIDRTRSEQGEVWKEQLGKIFEYTQKYYLPLAANIAALERYARNPKDPADRQRTFYHLTMLWLHVRLLRSDKGGFFFSTQEGEKIVSYGWKLLSISVRNNLGLANTGDEKLDEIAEALGSQESLPKFRRRFAGSAPEATLLNNAETEFLAWLDKGPKAAVPFDECLALMSIMRLVMRYEWDRPFYRYWYRESVNFDRKEYLKALQEIPKVPAKQHELFTRVAGHYLPARPFLVRVWKKHV